MSSRGLQAASVLGLKSPYGREGGRQDHLGKASEFLPRSSALGGMPKDIYAYPDLWKKKKKKNKANRITCKFENKLKILEP